MARAAEIAGFFLQKSLGVGDAARRASQRGVTAPGRSQPSYWDSLHRQNAGAPSGCSAEAAPGAVPVPRAAFKTSHFPGQTRFR